MLHKIATPRRYLGSLFLLSWLWLLAPWQGVQASFNGPFFSNDQLLLFLPLGFLLLPLLSPSLSLIILVVFNVGLFLFSHRRTRRRGEEASSSPRLIFRWATAVLLMGWICIAVLYLLSVVMIARSATGHYSEVFLPAAQLGAVLISALTGLIQVFKLTPKR